MSIVDASEMPKYQELLDNHTPLSKVLREMIERYLWNCQEHIAYASHPSFEGTISLRGGESISGTLREMGTALTNYSTCFLRRVGRSLLGRSEEKVMSSVSQIQIYEGGLVMIQRGSPYLVLIDKTGRSSLFKSMSSDTILDLQVANKGRLLVRRSDHTLLLLTFNGWYFTGEEIRLRSNEIFLRVTEANRFVVASGVVRCWNMKVRERFDLLLDKGKRVVDLQASDHHVCVCFEDAMKIQIFDVKERTSRFIDINLHEDTGSICSMLIREDALWVRCDDKILCFDLIQLDLHKVILCEGKFRDHSWTVDDSQTLYFAQAPSKVHRVNFI